MRASPPAAQAYALPRAGGRGRLARGAGGPRIAGKWPRIARSGLLMGLEPGSLGRSGAAWARKSLPDRHLHMSRRRRWFCE